jgi:hypothetical protein
LAERVCCRLRCFYPIASFPDPGQNELFLKLCAEHAAVIPNERRFKKVFGRDMNRTERGGFLPAG